MRFSRKQLVISLVTFALGAITASAVGTLHVFAPGQVIKASEINENFVALKNTIPLVTRNVIRVEQPNDNVVFASQSSRIRGYSQGNLQPRRINFTKQADGSTIMFRYQESLSLALLNGNIGNCSIGVLIDDANPGASFDWFGPMRQLGARFYSSSTNEQESVKPIILYGPLTAANGGPLPAGSHSATIVAFGWGSTIVRTYPYSGNNDLAILEVVEQP